MVNAQISTETDGAGLPSAGSGGSDTRRFWHEPAAGHERRDGPVS
jgi:hypothetical protein